MGQEYYKRKLKANKIRRKIVALNRAIKNSYFLLHLVLMFLIVFLGIKFLSSPLWYLDEEAFLGADEGIVKIEGNVITPKYRIINAVRQTRLPYEQLYKIDTTGIKESILGLQPIQNVYVRKFWLPARLHIYIQEYTPVLEITPSIDVEPNCAITKEGIYIDREYMPLDDRFKVYKILSFGSRRDDYTDWDKKRVSELVHLAQSFEAYSKQNVEYIDLRNSQDIYIKLDKFLIRFGELNATAKNRAKWIATIVPEANKFGDKVKYVDLRWDDAHYIKLKDNKAEPQKIEHEKYNENETN